MSCYERGSKSLRAHEDNDKFYNNSVEAINKLIKHWQNLKKKTDSVAFSKKYEELVQCQESDVLKHTSVCEARMLSGMSFLVM